MTNKVRSLDDLAFTVNDSSWVWKDDMIVFERDDGFYNEARERRIQMLHDLANDDNDHPICGEFPHDSTVAPRGF